MTIEVTIRDVLDPIKVKGDFASFINDLNITAASGKQFVICEEEAGGPIAFEIRNLTVMRAGEHDESFIGR